VRVKKGSLNVFKTASKNRSGNEKSHPVLQKGLMAAPQKPVKNTGLLLPLLLLALQLGPDIVVPIRATHDPSRHLLHLPHPLL